MLLIIALSNKKIKIIKYNKYTNVFIIYYILYLTLAEYHRIFKNSENNGRK